MTRRARRHDDALAWVGSHPVCLDKIQPLVCAYSRGVALVFEFKVGQVILPEGIRVLSFFIVLVAGLISGCVIGATGSYFYLQGQMNSSAQAAAAYQAQKALADDRATAAREMGNALVKQLDNEKHNVDAAVKRIDDEKRNGEKLLEKKDEQLKFAIADNAALAAKMSDLSKKLETLQNPKTTPTRRPRDPLLDDFPVLSSDKASIWISTDEATLVWAKKFSVVSELPDLRGVPWNERKKPEFRCALNVTDISSQETMRYVFTALGSSNQITFADRVIGLILTNTTPACLFQLAGR